MSSAEKLLKIAADMEMFSHGDDRLAGLVDEATDNELDFDELDRVAAASAAPSYEHFLRLKDSRRSGKTP